MHVQRPFNRNKFREKNIICPNEFGLWKPPNIIKAPSFSSPSCQIAQGTEWSNHQQFDDQPLPASPGSMAKLRRWWAFCWGFGLLCFYEVIDGHPKNLSQPKKELLPDVALKLSSYNSPNIEKCKWNAIYIIFCLKKWCCFFHSHVGFHHGWQH